MKNFTVAEAKKRIIKKIKKYGGLFENCGQDELRLLQEQNEYHFFDEKCEELNTWIESLDNQNIQQYL